MEPITHFLTGACMGRAGLNRKTVLATLTLTLAAEAPDLDVLASFHGRAFGFAHHRGFTHSLLGILLDAAVVVSFVYLIWRLRKRRTKDPTLPPRWGLLFFYAWLAGLSHILLDFTNNYGVRPFWPFSEKWYSWDIVFIWEPVMWALLLFGLLAPSLFSLIDREIGVRARGPRGRIGAALALLGIVLMWGVRDFEHRRAVAALESRTYEGADPLRVSAYPTLVSPFQWYGVVETSNFFALAPVDSLGPEVDPRGQLEIRYKPEETPIALAAKKSYWGRVFLDWAQYPITETETLESPQEGYIVHLGDLRYMQMPGLFERLRGRRVERGNRPSPLGAAVQLDRNLHVVGDVLDSGKGQVLVPEPD
ncbi:MAG: metal-dependent hydrolase [Candidatus Sulfotelmatobacter sp.]